MPFMNMAVPAGPGAATALDSSVGSGNPALEIPIASVIEDAPQVHARKNLEAAVCHVRVIQVSWVST